jgi:uncharacterized membrane protein YphA (DoxX/SURF4 family)
MSSEPNAQVDRTDPVEPATPRDAAPPPALTLVEPVRPEEPAEQAASRWGLARRILFRFAFAYLVLYSLPFPLNYIPYVDLLVQDYPEIWSFIVPWVGDDVFNVDITVQPSGSGDTTYNYVEVFCFLVLALAATAIWTFLDRRRANYVRLHDWLRVYVRLSLALWMLTYGAAKVIPTQFASPTPDRLLQTFGDSSPMGLLWTFMGASMAYTIFAGLSEFIGGLLLVARRTQLLGALVCIGVMTNVVLLNFSYDVPVKLFSSHLLLMAIFLILPDLRRLIDLFVLNRRVEPPVIRPLFRRKWLHRGALVLRTVFLLGWAGMFLYQGWQGSQEYGNRAPKPPLYGVWNVEHFEIDGVVRPPLVTDATRWRRMAFSYWGMTSIQLMSDTRDRYRLALDPAKKRMRLTRRDDPAFKSSLTYTQPGPKLLVIQGTYGDHRIRARLRQMDTSEFLLISRGFRWINEYPFNR